MRDRAVASIEKASSIVSCPWLTTLQHRPVQRNYGGGGRLDVRSPSGAQAPIGSVVALRAPILTGILVLIAAGALGMYAPQSCCSRCSRRL